MAEITLEDRAGKDAGTVVLDDTMFGIEPNVRASDRNERRDAESEVRRHELAVDVTCGCDPARAGTERRAQHDRLQLQRVPQLDTDVLCVVAHVRFSVVARAQVK